MVGMPVRRLRRPTGGRLAALQLRLTVGLGGEDEHNKGRGAKCIRVCVFQEGRRGKENRRG